MTDYEKQKVKDQIRGMTEEEKEIAKEELIGKKKTLECQVCGAENEIREIKTIEKKGLVDTARYEVIYCKECGHQILIGEIL